ncbi:MAG: RHS repeat domain-containing protein, partial [Clostridia bacterium]
KDPEGRTIVYGYDAWGNTSRIRELNSTPTDLNATNLLTLPGKEVTKTYNASGLLTKMVSAGGVTTTYTYDSKKNMLTSTVNGTDTTAYTYDFAGRITKTVTPQYYTGSAKDPGTVCTYYPNGKMKTKTDTCGNTTAFTYDLYGNEKTKTVPNGAVYEYDYDGISRVLHEYITENGEKKALKKYDYDLKLKNDAIAGDGATFFINAVTEYDGLTESAYTKKVMNERRRAIREIRPDGTIEKTEYNNNGTVKKVTNPLGYRTFHAYNGMNLETEKRVEVSANNFAYTGIIYDGAGRIISEKQGIGYSTEVGVCTNYVTKTKSYYLDGNVKSEETVDGKKITYEYDLDGKPVKKDEYVDANSKITTSYINDYNGKPIQIRQNIDNIDLGTGTSGTTETTIVNTYDKDGNLLTSVNQEGTVTSNVYDKLGRVVRTQTSGTDEYGAPSPHVSWKTYDCMGKIAQFSDENGNLTINTYDARGNLIRKTQKNGSKDIVHAFEYDLKNRPVREVTPANYDTSKATLVGMNHTQYTYDNMNREIIK